MIFPIKLKLSTFIFIKVLKINLVRIYLSKNSYMSKKPINGIFYK